MNYDLTKYKKAKKIVKDLQEVLYIMRVCRAALKFFNVYNPVHDCILNLNNNIKILELHLKKHKKILETKGKTSD